MAEKTYRFYIRQGEFELDLEGDQAFVESYLEAFFEGESVAAKAVAGRAKIPAKASRGAKGKKEVAKKTPAVDSSALSAHLKGRRLKSHKDRILAYLGFLTATGAPDFGVPSLQACFAANGVRFPAAGRQYFQILKKQGLVTKGSGWGLWKLTEAGKAAAEAAGKAAPKRAKKPGRRKAAGKKTAKRARKAPAKKAPAKAAKPKKPVAKAKPRPKRKPRGKRKAGAKTAAPAAEAAQNQG